MSLGKRAPKHRKILCVGIGQAAVDGTVSRHDYVAQKLLLVQAKQRAAVGHQGAQFFKAALVKKEFEALACRQLLFGVLGVNTCLAAAELRLGALSRKRFKCFG